MTYTGIHSCPSSEPCHVCEDGPALPSHSLTQQHALLTHLTQTHPHPVALGSDPPRQKSQTHQRPHPSPPAPIRPARSRCVRTGITSVPVSRRGGGWDFGLPQLSDAAGRPVDVHASSSSASAAAAAVVEADAGVVGEVVPSDGDVAAASRRATDPEGMARVNCEIVDVLSPPDRAGAAAEGEGGAGSARPEPVTWKAREGVAGPTGAVSQLQSRAERG